MTSKIPPDKKPTPSPENTFNLMTPHQKKLTILMNQILDQNNEKTTQKALDIIDNKSISDSGKIKEIRKLSNGSKSSTKSSSIFSKTFNKKSKIHSIPPVLGIPNCGNTCFLNAGFQLVMNDPLLTNALVKTYETIPSSDRKYKAYQCFLDSVTKYQNGEADQIKLAPLRVLFDDKETRGRSAFGDVTEFINVLLRPVKPDKYLELFCTINEQKTYTPSKTPVSATQKANISKYSTIPSNNTIQEFAYLSTISLPIPTSQGPIEGGQLLSDYFSQKRALNDDPGLFESNDQLKYFQPISSQTTLVQASPRINISLKRFDSEGQKIIKDVIMPKILRVPVRDTLQTYHLKSVALHSGDHYLALIEKEGTYYTANDDVVNKTSKTEEDTFLKQGYLYCYELASGT